MSCQTWKRFFRFQSLRRAPSTREVSRAQFCSAGDGGRNTTSAEKGGTVSGQTVVSARRGAVVTVAINRPEVRNAVNRETAARLLDELSAFDRDPQLNVAILHGNGGNFCAGYDLKELANHTASVKLEQDVTKGPGPMGPSRLQLSKPLIAAVSGYAVAGGLELALLADLRVLEESAIMGVFCRRFGVPLIDGGTVRLPHLIGLSRAMDLILTGRPIGAQEALAFGLANRVVPDGQACTLLPRSLPPCSTRPSMGRPSSGPRPSPGQPASPAEWGEIRLHNYCQDSLLLKTRRDQDSLLLKTRAVSY
ncbi:enoyl-CoA hydratase EchA19 isoform X2 [Osmerus eperlanus]|uniref:enoyl-CoA hydratase EchA19 isoform X2 n=1 Tax=Osmerus eperlanus TaxID=29151 RepID=UPI002E137461